MAVMIMVGIICSKKIKIMKYFTIAGYVIFHFGETYIASAIGAGATMGVAEWFFVMEFLDCGVG